MSPPSKTRPPHKTVTEETRATKRPATKRPATKAAVAKTPSRKAEETRTKTRSVAKRPAPGNAAGSEAALSRVSELCLGLPNTKLTMTWGSPHFRVGEKIFCGFGEEDGKQVLGVKLEMNHARAIVKDARFWPSPYVGKHGWVSMDLSRRRSWDEVEALIRESYGLIAAKSSRRKQR